MNFGRALYASLTAQKVVVADKDLTAELANRILLCLLGLPQPEEPICEHNEDTPDDIYWQWVSGDGYCMLCGECV